MSERLLDSSCREFVEVLGSKAAVPGGGGASALAGAIGAALGSMVANLTIPNGRYEAVRPQMEQLLSKMEALSEALLDCVEEDAKAFEPLSKAYGLPKNTEEEKVEKARILEEALWVACQPPLRMAHLCAEAIEVMAEMAEIGAKLVISDAGTGAALLRGALEGAILNVYVNTNLMKNRERAEAVNAECERLAATAAIRAETIYQSVLGRIRG